MMNVHVSGVPLAGGEHPRENDGCCPPVCCLCALGEYLNAPVSYDMMMCLTGVAFRLLWSRRGFDPDISETLEMDARDPLYGLRRGAAALGFKAELYANARAERPLFCAPAAEDVRALIERSLKSGVPVLALGVVAQDWSLITGIGSRGELIGSSPFQRLEGCAENLSFTPEGEFIAPKWHADLRGLLLLSDRLPGRSVPDIPEMLRQAFFLLESPDGGIEMYRGVSAYGAWSEALRWDPDFPRGQDEVLMQRYAVHRLAAWMVEEGRACAARTLRGWPEYARLADCFERTAAIMRGMDGVLVGPRDTDRAALSIASRERRLELAARVLTARDCEERAIEEIERLGFSW